ncbi:MAG: 5-formyltetrahydrofolate cyclo-ligase [Nitrosomonas sp.]
MKNDWKEWRKEKRKQLITAREAIPKEVHQQWSANISAFLQKDFPQLNKLVLGIYWPFHNEYDPRLVAPYFLEQGVTLALPEVVQRNEPLCFRKWTPESAMRKGEYDIPVPADAPSVIPNALLIPMVGFDSQGYRLGYGSGYFDRTLANYDTLPMAIGIAFELQRLPDTYPQPHDIPMHYIVTEAGIHLPNAA